MQTWRAFRVNSPDLHKFCSRQELRTRLSEFSEEDMFWAGGAIQLLVEWVAVVEGVGNRFIIPEPSHAGRDGAIGRYTPKFEIPARGWPDDFARHAIRIAEAACPAGG